MLNDLSILKEHIGFINYEHVQLVQVHTFICMLRIVSKMMSYCCRLFIDFY